MPFNRKVPIGNSSSNKINETNQYRFTSNLDGDGHYRQNTSNSKMNQASQSTHYVIDENRSNQLRKESMKHRSLSNKYSGSRYNDTKSKDELNDYNNDSDESLKISMEANHHTICLGTTSIDFSVPCSRNENWAQLEESIIDLFESRGQLKPGKMKQTHENISSLLNSNFGMFVYERLKSQVLPKAVRMLKADLKDDDEDYLQTLASIWKTFYCDILSTLECMLFYIEPFNNVSVRRTTLEIFRDHVLVNSSLESNYLFLF
ncbi:hypothetical protein SSS_04199 [Sarcoptes scabiei]|nr:hypothetical protein SSS_04199 [Sarcoptes scabiei]